MDEFFQKLREIQKKERNLSGLAPVGEDFYQNVSLYFNTLMKKIDNNPFSFESYLLRDAQRITAEICERREHKISKSAVMSVQRTFQLFNESESYSPKIQKIPRNSTPEEKKLYNALVDSLVNYREKMRIPLRFHSVIEKDESAISKNNTNHKENAGKNIENVQISGEISGSKAKESEIKISESMPRTERKNSDISKSELSDLKDSNNSNSHDSISFTPEEEAAVDDDIYKKFGNEPFPGDKLKKKVKKHHPIGKNIKNGNNKHKDDNTQPKNQNNQRKIKTNVLLILEELPPIMGVDKEVYGPFLPQDIITIPEPNARILIKNQKGKPIQKYK